MSANDVQLRIVGRDLPGRRGQGYDNLFLGIQRKSEVIDLVPGDALSASFELNVETRQLDQGRLDFAGPFVHGRRNDRFLYLSWMVRREAYGLEMLARIKLFLTDIGRDLIDDALQHGVVLQGSLPLATQNGRPRSGGVRPPDMQWTRIEPDHA